MSENGKTVTFVVVAVAVLAAAWIARPSLPEAEPSLIRITVGKSSSG